MHTQLTEFWVVKTYKIEEGKDFSYIMGLSEISMLNALTTALGTGLLDEVSIKELSDKRWEATGKPGTEQEGIHYNIQMRHDCPPLPNWKYSIWDNRLEAHMREPRKSMPKADQLKFF